MLLDDGIASWNMPETIFDAVYHGLGGRGEAPGATRYVRVDCVYRHFNHTKS